MLLLLSAVLLAAVARPTASVAAGSCLCQAAELCSPPSEPGGPCRMADGAPGRCCDAPCRPATQCLPEVQLRGRRSERWCRLPDGSPGARCHLTGGRQARALGLQPQPLDVSRLPGGGGERALTVPAEVDMSLATEAGANALRRLLEVNRRMMASGDVPAPGSPSLLSTWNSPSSLQAQQMGLSALQTLHTLQALKPGVRRRGGRQMSLERLPGCEPEPVPDCDRTAIYRTASGECNNLERPLVGRSLMGFRRIMADTFEDAVFLPRATGVRGRPLPNPRYVSQRTMDTRSAEAEGFTLSVMQWGQFVDHDLTQAPVFRLDSGEGIECCEDGGRTLPDRPRHPLCVPIPIPARDPFFSRHGQRCLSAVRSLPALDPECRVRAATQLNAITGYLDLSTVYGSNEEEQRRLRSRRGGLLLTGAGDLLPDRGTEPDRLTGEPTGGRCRGTVCFRAGDERVNEQGGLVAIHTIFMREHNRIARELSRRHLWGDEHLFQEARRVLIAEMQHVLYNEWLPMVVGREFARQHGLLPLPVGYSTLYDSSVDARPFTSFSTAAFRFGHSMVRDTYELLAADGRVRRVVNLTSTFFEPSVLIGNLEDIARTLVGRRPEAVDMTVASAVHELLFNADGPHGLDLIALNIQRGREHGIPTYATALAACTGHKTRSWADLRTVMSEFSVDLLRAVYDDPRDVDLFVGGLAERPADDALVGPTFRCLIGQQFFDDRYGDRHFHDNGGMRHSFSEEQLREIRKSSWAGILCSTLGPDHDGDFEAVQPLAFLAPAGDNAVVDCRSSAISRPDLSVF